MAALLRRADVNDAAAIAACVHRAYAKYEGRLPRAPKPVLADYTAVVRNSPTWLLEDDGQCVGVLVLVPKADHLLLENVAVDPAHQGRGLGRLLMDFAEAEARRLGLPARNSITHPPVRQTASARGEQASRPRVVLRLFGDNQRPPASLTHVAGSGARARSRNLVRAASPHLSLATRSSAQRCTNV